MAFEMTSAPRVSPFLPVGGGVDIAVQRPPAFTSAPMPGPAKPAAMLGAPAMLKPTLKPDLPSYVQSAGTFARKFHDVAKGQIETAQRAGLQPAGPWHPPIYEEVKQDPAGLYERLSSSKVDDGIAAMKEKYGEEIPTDLSRQEKGMLLMQLGFGIMAGGPGLAQALGQSGMQMMGSWHDLRREKRREGEAKKKGELAILDKETDIALSREEAADRRAESATERDWRTGESAADRAARQAEFAARQGLSREELAARLREGELDRAQRDRLAQMDQGKPYTDVAKLNADLKAGLITPEQHKTALASGAGQEPLRIQREAQYVSQLYGISEADAHRLNTLSAESRLNPEKTKQDILRAALSANGGRADRAIVEAEKAMSWLQGNAEPEKAPETPPPGVLETLLNMLPGGGEETATAGGPVPAPAPAPAPGTIENGYRFKGGDPANQNSWEPVAAGR